MREIGKFLAHTTFSPSQADTQSVHLGRLSM
jgi:hypothetical protein